MTHALLPSIADAGIIATLRAPNADAAYGAVDALVTGGITAIEVTYTTPGAGAVIAGLAERFGDAIILGAGTLTTVEQVEESAASGAVFFVSPGLDDEVFEAIVATGGLSMIGGFTATLGVLTWQALSAQSIVSPSGPILVAGIAVAAVTVIAALAVLLAGRREVAAAPVATVDPAPERVSL